MKEYNTKEELIEAVYNDRYGNTEKEGLDKIIDILYEFRNGTPMKLKNRGQCYYSINDIAEKIFASQVDLNANEYDTKQLWEKCIDKAIIIYFNYQTVIDKVDDFFTKSQLIYDDLQEEEKEKIKKLWIKH